MERDLMKRTIGSTRSVALWVGASVIALSMAAGTARAADVPTSLTLSWLTTCMSGQIKLSVNGTPVGTFDVQGGDTQCNCNDYEKTVTLTDAATLAALDTKA